MLASNASGAEQNQDGINDFVSRQSVFLSQLLSGVVLDVSTPAATIAKMPLALIGLGFVQTTLVARDDGYDDTDDNIIQATKKVSRTKH